MLVGYARTSTAEQIAGLDAQERDLRAAGAAEMYREAIGIRHHRSALAACLKFLRKGDALVVTTRPDRLARSTRELLETRGGSDEMRRRVADTVNGVS